MRRAFTVLEVLVVLVILGVLMALLMPVLASANERAKESSELSRFHQCAIAQSLYQERAGEPALGTVPLIRAGLLPSEIAASPLDSTSLGWANDLLQYMEGRSGTYVGMRTPYRRSFVGPWDYAMRYPSFQRQTGSDPNAGWLVSFAGTRPYMAGINMGTFPKGAYKRLLLSGTVVPKKHRYQGGEEGTGWDVSFLFSDETKLNAP